MRKAEIDAVNAEHAPGGDHDPILTQCRQDYLNSLVKKYGVEGLTPGEMRYYPPDASK